MRVMHSNEIRTHSLQLLTLSCLLLQVCIPQVSARGLSVIAGKGRGHVCTDCEPSEFDAGELTWALVTLGIVTTIFLAICTCRCYPKLKLVFCDGGVVAEGRARVRKQMPRNRVMMAGPGAYPQKTQQMAQANGQHSSHIYPGPAYTVNSRNPQHINPQLNGQMNGIHPSTFAPSPHTTIMSTGYPIRQPTPVLTTSAQHYQAHSQSHSQSHSRTPQKVAPGGSKLVPTSLASSHNPSRNPDPYSVCHI